MLSHLLTALSGSQAYRGSLVTHGRNYRNSSVSRPVDFRRIESVLAYCRIADDEGTRADIEDGITSIGQVRRECRI